MPTLKDTATIIGRAARIGGHIAHEKLTRHRPTTPDVVPASAEAITPEWLSAVLCGAHPGARVEKVEIIGGSSGTSSRLGIRVRYNAAGEAAGLPPTLYTKSTALWTQRMVLGLAGVIQGETAFFSRVRPRLKIEAPLGYHAAFDARSWRSITLMEDIVATKGAVFNSPATEITRARIEDLLINMATWHGTMWDSPLFRNELSWLMTPEQFCARIDALIGMRKRSLIGAQRAEHVIPKTLFPRQQALYESWGRSFAQLSQGPLTFLHGDSHVGNTYTTRDGRMGYSDWQIVQKGGWAYDYAYILTTSLTVENRRAWEKDLLRLYLEHLHAAGAPKLSFDTAWLNYRQSLFYPYFAWVFTLGAGALQPAMQPTQVCLPIIERTSHAIDDLDAIGAMGDP